MIAKYIDYEYIYVSNRRSKEIITSQKKKIRDGFIFENGRYYKSVNENELTDIYSVSFFVKYETEYIGVSGWWELGNEQNVIADNQVQLIFAEGILPNWKIVDKNVCSMSIPLDKISSAKMVRTYKKKDGIVLDEKLNEEKIISLEELKQLHNGYCRVNL